ncbi:MAG: F0F1 ATP synthase subunit B [Planctomycetota bacterium]
MSTSPVLSLALLAAEGGGFNPLTFDPAAAVLTLLTFFGLLFAISKFAWKPILAAIEQREQRIDEALSKSERDRAASEKLLAEARTAVSGVESQMAALREKGQAEAEALRREIRSKAEAEAAAATDKARREIELARNQALQDIRREAVTLSMAAAGKVVGRSLDSNDQRRLAEEAIGGLAKVGG